MRDGDIQDNSPVENTQLINELTGRTFASKMDSRAFRAIHEYRDIFYLEALSKFYQNCRVDSG